MVKMGKKLQLGRKEEKVAKDQVILKNRVCVLHSYLDIRNFHYVAF